MDDRALARWRLHTMRLAGDRYTSPVEAVRGLLAVQAENFAQTLWALAARTGAGREELQQLFDDGAFLRTHVLRPTWHFATPEDLRWLVELTAPRVRKLYRQLQLGVGLTDAQIAAGIEVIVDALTGGVHLTREAIAQSLTDAGIPVEGQRLGVVLANAELDAVVCSGVMEGSRQTYALLDERAPNARRLERDDALAEIVLRYFSGHGPATERDLSYWATLTLTDVRRGLARVGDQLDSLEHDGRTYWFARNPPEGTQPLHPRGHLLLTLDEYHNGYQDSRSSLDADRIVPAGRAANVGMTLVDGQMVGNMRRTLTNTTATFEVRLFRALADDEKQAVDEVAQRYGPWLDLEPRLVLHEPG